MHKLGFSSDFLIRSEYGMHSSRGKSFCKTYVRGLREGWAERIELASAGKPVNRAALDEVREAALLAALREIDLKVAEGAFERYVKASVAFLPR